MDVVISQHFGLGDILFIEPIYRHYHNRGFKVVAPINPEYLWIKEYIPYVEFVDVNSYPYNKESVTQKPDGKFHIPLRFAHPLFRGYELHYGDDRAHWMSDKYEYLGLPVDLWKTLSFTRNKEREQKLFDLLELNGKKYVFYNCNFGGSFEHVDILYLHDKEFSHVTMKPIDGFTMLDWGVVIENAEQIHTVETSLVYYVESLKTKATEFHLYPRLPWLPNVDYMKELLGEKWIYYEGK